MKKWYFNIFVEKILKRKWKLLSDEQIQKLVSESMGENYTRAKGYKLVHLAKNKGHIISLRKDLYYIPLSLAEIGDITLSGEEQENNIIEKWYRTILHDHIKRYCDNKCLITWTTALHILLQNYEIPDTINLISPDKQAVETIVRDKKVAIKKMNAGKTSLYLQLKQHAKKVDIRGKSFYMTSLSISLLEALYANKENELLTIELSKKIIRKYWKQLDRNEIVSLLRKGKYHSSMNKLYKIARSIDEKYAQCIMDLIKKHSYRISL